MLGYALMIWWCHHLCWSFSEYILCVSNTYKSCTHYNSGYWIDKNHLKHLKLFSGAQGLIYVVSTSCVYWIHTRSCTHYKSTSTDMVSTLLLEWGLNYQQLKQCHNSKFFLNQKMIWLLLLKSILVLGHQRGVCEVHLLQAYKPCVFGAIPSQT